MDLLTRSALVEEAFNPLSLPVTSLYDTFLPLLETEWVGKVVTVCTDGADEAIWSVVPDRNDRELTVALVHTGFDGEALLRADERERAELLLGRHTEAVLWLARRRGWPIDDLVGVADQVRASGFEATEEGPWTARRGTGWRARWVRRMAVDGGTVELQVCSTDDDGPVGLFVQAVSGDWLDLRDRAQKVVWTGPERVELRPRTRRGRDGSPTLLLERQADGTWHSHAYRRDMPPAPGGGPGRGR